jgi:hypothetical protein
VGFLNFFNKKSQTNAETTSTSNDNRVVNDASGGGILGNGNTLDSSTTTNNLTSWLDASVHEYSNADNSVSLSNSGNTDSSVRLTDNSTRDNSVRFTDNSTRDNSVRNWADNSVSLSDSSSRYAYTDGSIRVQDSSSRDNSSRTWLDSSSSSVNVTNTGIDAAEVIGLNVGLLQSMSKDQGDTVQFLAQAGFNSINTAAHAATDLFQTGSSEAGKAWGATLDKVGETLDKLMLTTRQTVGDTLQAANNVSSRAIQSNPDASAGLNTKIALIGAAAVLLAAVN